MAEKILKTRILFWVSALVVLILVVAILELLFSWD